MVSMNSTGPQASKPLQAALPPSMVSQPELLLLFVDDSADDQVLFQTMCRKAGVPFKWVVVESAEQAIAHFESLLALSRKEPQSVPWPDLVLLDIVMPGGDGLQVLEFIRVRPELRPLPVIILTGNASPALKEEAYALGVNSFLEKPTKPEEIVELFRRLYSAWVMARRPKL